ncbi:MAG: hypothetical protein AAGU11_08370 [Syntrophobacteraceae bacterium]
MKFGSRTIRTTLLGLGAGPGASVARKLTTDEPPLRSELFSADQMKQHGKTLAGWHRLSHARSQDRLLTRLAENKDVLPLGPQSADRGSQG